MNKHYKLLSTTAVPQDDGECKVEIHLYQIDDEENMYLHDLRDYQNDPDKFLDLIPDDEKNDSYYQDIKEDGTFCDAVLAALNLYEEPDYAVPPGGIYHRYDVYLMWGVVVVIATTAINV